MDFTDEQMRRFREAANQGKREYEQRMKIEESLRKRGLRNKKQTLGIKVIKGGKSS